MNKIELLNKSENILGTDHVFIRYFTKYLLNKKTLEKKGDSTNFKIKLSCAILILATSFIGNDFSVFVMLFEFLMAFGLSIMLEVKRDEKNYELFDLEFYFLKEIKSNKTLFNKLLTDNKNLEKMDLFKLVSHITEDKPNGILNSLEIFLNELVFKNENKKVFDTMDNLMNLSIEKEIEINGKWKEKLIGVI